MLRKLFNWIFKSELDILNSEISKAKLLVSHLEKQQKAFDCVLQNIDVSVDVHEWKHSPSWAVISLQGQKTDFIKFVDLGDSNGREISQFLRKFECNSNIKVDASPMTSQFLRISKTI